MPRIRSTHPGQWPDAEFCQCSPLARLLAIALRNFADDNGVFEWKPAELKINCLPYDNCDIKKLLAELVTHGLIKTFDDRQRRYGAIRNFKTWQRPQKPKAIHPCPPAIQPFLSKDHNSQAFSDVPVQETVDPETGEVADGSSISTPPVPNTNDPVNGVGFTSTGKTTQRKEVGGRRKEVTKTGNGEGEESSSLHPDRLSEVQSIWPHDRKRGSDRNVWDFRVMASVGDSLAREALAQTILAAAREHVAGWGGLGTTLDKVPNLASWLEGSRWLETPAKVGARVRKRPPRSDPEVRAVLVARFARLGGTWPTAGGERPGGAELAEAMRAWRTHVRAFDAGNQSWDAALYGEERPSVGEIKEAALADIPANLSRL